MPVTISGEDTKHGVYITGVNLALEGILGEYFNPALKESRE